MLLIKFYSSFCSIHRLYILKIGIHLEHEEINWNLELQNQKAEGRTRSKNRESAEIPCQFRKVITTQIVLLHTLNTPGFEHFLRSNQPN